jgi:DNA-binding CsgD family transcriptional regulator
LGDTVRMTANLEEFIEASAVAGSEPELRAIYLQAVEAEGYQNAVFAKARCQRLISIPWNHFPIGYSQNYISHEWDKIDPIVQHIHSAFKPFRWDNVCASAHLTNRQKIFLNECRELGVHSGITIPLHGPGAEIDLISLSLRDQNQINNARFHVVYALTVQYRLRLSEMDDEPTTDVDQLTSKEIECLCWCKEGKTNWEIGQILSISEKTVEFHLSNTVKKLGVSNRITAVVKGIQKGIISI